MEPFGLLTQEIDFTLVILYSFWLFFAGLVFYLLREGRREGYPLVDDITGKREKGGVIWIPEPKTFHTHTGEVHHAPDSREVEPEVTNAVPSAPFPGSPLVPTGNPLTAGVGPGSFAQRQDRPDVTAEGELKLVPMRTLSDHAVAEDDADPRGMEVIGADGLPAGTVEDMWIDRSEMLVRYLEVRLDPSLKERVTAAAAPATAAAAVGGEAGDVAVATAATTATAQAAGDTVLLPMNTATVAPMYGQVSTAAILASQFADVPRLKDPGRITLLEGGRIMAYFAAGELYATPQRSEPLL